MPVVVCPVSSLFIEIGDPGPSTQVKLYLEEAGSSRPLYSCIPYVMRPLIPGPGPFDHRSRNIVRVVANVRIEVSPIAVVMSNHFPTVFPATVIKIGMPLTIGLSPVGVICLREIPVKRLLNSFRRAAIVILGQ